MQLCGGLAPASLENKVYNKFILLVLYQNVQHNITE